jgi:hypothetical protein
MPKRYFNRAMTAKTEGSYGVDSIPTGGANAILCSTLELDIPVEYVERELLTDKFGSFPAIGTRRFAKVSFETELQSSGTAGTAPAWAPLVRACGFSQTLNAGVSAVYAPSTAIGESCTMRFYLDGIMHAISGARGTVKLMMPRNKVPKLAFEMTGLYSTPTDTAMPTMDYTAWKDPRAADKAGTPTFTLHGTATVLRDLQLDIGNVVTVRDLPNAMDVHIVDRKVVGSCSIELVPIATKNWAGIEVGETVAAMSLIHGTSAGKIVEIAAPKVQLRQPKYGQEEGIAYLDLGLQLNRNAGDDEIVLTSR